MPTYTARELLTLASDYLRRKKVPEAENLATILLSERLQIPPLKLNQSSRPATPQELDQLRTDLKALANQTPIQYLLGEWPFRNLMLQCDSRALIPRPETELLVENILKLPLPAHPQIADLGTGTGAIGLALAQELPEASVLLTDISPDALELAQINAKRHHLTNVAFALADAFIPTAPASLDLLVSNPPYIATKEVATLPPHIRLHEPTLALDGGPDGLDIYRRIVPQALISLKPRGTLALEIGCDQGKALRQLLTHHGFSHIRVLQDYNRLDRFVFATVV